MNSELSYFVKLNGVYDILASLAILKYLPLYIVNDMHLSMLNNYNYDNKIFERFFAYWIFTYGIIRLFSTDKKLIIYSYLIEALCILNECYTSSSLATDKSTVVIFCCLYIAYLIYKK